MKVWPHSYNLSLNCFHYPKNDRISHPCNLISPLNFFQVHEDCDQFRIANGTSPLLRHHKGHGSNNKDSCNKSSKVFDSVLIFIKINNPSVTEVFLSQ